MLVLEGRRGEGGVAGRRKERLYLMVEGCRAMVAVGRLFGMERVSWFEAMGEMRPVDRLRAVGGVFSSGYRTAWKGA